MKKGTAYTKWEKNVSIQFEQLKKEYHMLIEKAREGFQIVAHNKFLEKVGRTEYTKIQHKLGNHQRFLIDIEHEMEEDKYKDFTTLFNEKFSAIEFIDKEILLKDLALLKALNKMYSYCLAEGLKYRQNPIIEPLQSKNSIKWNGSTDLEFIQLVYALKEAGYLDNEEGQITTLTKQVAEAFNYKLKKHWQSTLSDNINNRNVDYQPKIFENLIKAFSAYRDRQNKKKKLN